MESQTKSSQNHNQALSTTSPDNLGDLFLGIPFGNSVDGTGRLLDAEAPLLDPIVEAIPSTLTTASTLDEVSHTASQDSVKQSRLRNVAVASAAVSAAYLGQRGLHTDAVKSQGEYASRKAGEVMSHSKDASVLVLAGLRKNVAKWRRDRILGKEVPAHRIEAERKTEGVQAILDTRYPARSMKPVTRTERGHVARASRNRHAAKKRRGDLFFESKLYGTITHDKDTLKELYATGHYSRKEKKAMQSNGRRWRSDSKYLDKKLGSYREMKAEYQYELHNPGESKQIAIYNNDARKRMFSRLDKALKLDKHASELEQKIVNRAYRGPSRVKNAVHATSKHAVAAGKTVGRGITTTSKRALTATKAVGQAVTVPFNSLREGYSELHISNLEGQIARLKIEADFHDKGNDEANIPTGKDLSEKAKSKRAKAYDLSRSLTYAKQEANARRKI